MLVHFAIDAMGGDLAISERVQASLRALQEIPYLAISLVGDPQLIKAALSNPATPSLGDRSRLTIVPSKSIVSMGEQPSKIIRNKLDSSMAIALKMVSDKRADACLSSGNTGALVALSMHFLDCVDNQLERPAICTALPHGKGQTWLLDMGANLYCNAKQLHYLAILASELCSQIEGIQSPKIGLLNVGKEAIKGTEVMQQASQLIQKDSRLNYSGFAEGDDILRGQFNVIVCDGLLGNIALKSIEGAVGLILNQLQPLSKQLPEDETAPLTQKRLQALMELYSPKRYNGAVLLGIDGLVVKSHGMADTEAFYHAIIFALQMRTLSPI